MSSKQRGLRNAAPPIAQMALQWLFSIARTHLTSNVRFSPHRRWRVVSFALLMLTAFVGATVYALLNLHAFATVSREALALAAIFFSGIVASIVGFAFSAIAGSVLAHLYPDPVEMVRVLLVCSITIQTYCTLMLWRSIRWRESAPYLVGGLLTAPLGVFMLAQISAHAYTLILGAFLVSYGLYSLARPIKVAVHGKPGVDALIGALGGITGGLAAFPGAFVTLWCAARGLTKETQRAICQPYIFFMQLATLAMLQAVHGTDIGDLFGLWKFVATSLLAAIVGFGLFRNLTQRQFRILVLNMLTASGLVLVFRSF